MNVLLLSPAAMNILLEMYLKYMKFKNGKLIWPTYIKRELKLSLFDDINLKKINLTILQTNSKLLRLEQGDWI